MPHPHRLTPELVAARQRARADYVDVLRDTYPDPDDPIRRRAEAELDSWWPGTGDEEGVR